MVNPNWPTVAVQIEFTTGTWTDITSRVQDLDCSRGRQYELDHATAGTMRTNLDNKDGALSPTNASSPYYPNVQLYKRIRVRVTWSGVTKTLWTGYIERYPTEWVQENGNYQMTPLVAVDAIGMLSQATLLKCYAAYLNSLAPVRWWPLDDRDTSSGVGTYNCRVTGLPAFERTKGGKPQVSAAASPILGDEGGNVPFFNPPRPGMPSNDSPAPNFSTIRLCNGTSAEMPVSGTWSILLSCYIPTSTYQLGDMQLLTIEDVTGNQVITLIGGTSGSNYFRYFLQDVVGNSSLVDTVRTDDGLPHLLYFEMSAAQTSWRYSVDGAAPTTVTKTFNFNAIQTVELGGNWPISDALHQQAACAYISNVAVFNRALTNTELANAANASNTGYNLQRSDQRLSSILSAAGRSALFGTPLDNGSAVLQTAAFNGNNAGQLVQDLTDWEGGNIFVNGDGLLIFASRHFRDNPVSAYTLGPSGYPLSDLKLDYDITRLLNDVQVSRRNGGTLRAVNAASVAQYGTFSAQLNSDVADDNQALAQAQYESSTYAQPKTRVSTLALDPASNPSIWPLVTGLDINSCVTVAHTPQAGTPVTMTCWVESIGYTIGPGIFRVLLDLSPDLSQKWYKAGDATYGVLGSSAANLLGY